MTSEPPPARREGPAWTDRTWPVRWEADARIRMALIDELAAHGLTIDSPRELWPEGMARRVRDRVIAAHGRAVMTTKGDKPMTLRQNTIAVATMVEFASHYAMLGDPLSARTLLGAMTDAGGPDDYPTVDDFKNAYATFIIERRLRRRMVLPAPSPDSI